MYMNKAKKEREEYILSRFVSNPALGMMISGIVPMDPPDFKIRRYNNDRFQDIGVELTTVTNPDLKAKEAAQDRIVPDAYLLFKSEFEEVLRVFVNFKINVAVPRDPPSLNALSQELFEMVKTIHLNNSGYNFYLTSKDLKFKHKIFDGITISNELNYEDWRPFGAFKVPYIDEAWFAEKIRRKEEILQTYSNKFEENWLVMIANFGHQSTAFQFSNLLESFDQSPFDRIFIYNYFPNKIKIVK
ncbi:hypothetical protein MASR2M41_14210 [Flammeovirgaceae bacterium]